MTIADLVDENCRKSATDTVIENELTELISLVRRGAKRPSWAVVAEWFREEHEIVISESTVRRRYEKLERKIDGPKD